MFARRIYLRRDYTRSRDESGADGGSKLWIANFPTATTAALERQLRFRECLVSPGCTLRVQSTHQRIGFDNYLRSFQIAWCLRSFHSLLLSSCSGSGKTSMSVLTIFVLYLDVHVASYVFTLLIQLQLTPGPVVAEAVNDLYELS